MNSRAQVTAEFLVVIIALLFVLNFAFSIYSSNLQLFSDFAQTSEMKISAANIGNALDSVLFAGNGASAEFLFERKLDYNAGVSGSMLSLRSKNALVDFPLSTSDINFSNFEFNKKLKISNNLGRVVVENA